MKISNFHQIWAYFWVRHFLQNNGSFWRFPTKKKQNIRIKLNWTIWQILKFKTVFDWIWSISHSFERKKSFPGNSYLISDIASFWQKWGVFLSIYCKKASKHLKKLEELCVVHFVVQNPFWQYVSHYTCLMKKNCFRRFCAYFLGGNFLFHNVSFCWFRTKTLQNTRMT